LNRYLKEKELDLLLFKNVSVRKTIKHKADKNRKPAASLFSFLDSCKYEGLILEKNTNFD